ncbi:hypothetical protein L6452_13122 [Arctium lappa]|uniref:Uncharacterized protein n=1 Tax=Arctium lappa TaxID=4217 RepID=A0ACB9CHB8_ARCLA|nr:hypothetical protein L6452_13122 [Arctium lappa]
MGKREGKKGFMKMNMSFVLLIDWGFALTEKCEANLFYAPHIPLPSSNPHFTFPFSPMEDNEWETIQQPSSSATQSDEDADGDAVVVVTRPTDFTDPSVFATISHEGLLVSPQSPQADYLREPVPETPSSPSSYSSSSTPIFAEVADGEFPQAPEVRNTVLKASFGVLSSWVLRIGYGIRSRIGFWSIASVAAFVTVVAYGRRWRRLAEKENRDRLALLINQKDEKIKQLLLQIERMNAALSAQRRVPVLRVVVDSPLMIGPRANWKPT